MGFSRYRRAYGGLVAGGMVVGALIGLLLALVLPADPGEGGVAVLVVLIVIGAVMGVVTGLFAAGAGAVVLSLWRRRSKTSAGSRILVGTLAASAGAAVPALGLGLIRAATDPYGFAGFLVFGWVAGASTVLALPLSVALFAVAERRATRQGR